MTVHNTLSDWLETPHGQYLLEREQALFDQGVVDIFGYNAMQLGLCDHELLRGARIPLRVLAGYDASAQVLTRADELPFDSGSLDLVLLPHVLEYAEHPHHITREIERVMMPGGHLLLTGFNPRSLWGLRRWLGRKNGYPWCGKFISSPRIRDWLELLGFEVVAGRFACYAPPMGRPGWLNHMRFLEPSGDRWWAVWGGVYFLHAVKRVPGMRPIKPKWAGGLMGNLLPVRPKLTRKVSHDKSMDSQ